MTLQRRCLLALTAAAGLMPVMGGRAAAADRPFAPEASDWRSFQMQTTVTLASGQGPAQVWLPVPALDTDYQRTTGTGWTGNAAQAELATDPVSGARYLHARFTGAEAPHLVLSSTFQTRNRIVDWGNPTPPPREDPAVLAAALKPTARKPLDGIVAQTARRITAGASTDLGKVRALYVWIVGHCHHDLDTPGCGLGDAVATLTTAGLGGKSADLNGLFVALARASGVPARDIYGVRVAPSAFGYRQLGVSGATITTAQHCRAEVWLQGYGWVAMDPADVLKVMRAETDTWIRDPADPAVRQVFTALAGNCEGNWAGFNTAEDVRLAGRDGTLPFLIYPQASVGGRMLDELDARAFRYAITARSL